MPKADLSYLKHLLETTDYMFNTDVENWRDGIEEYFSDYIYVKCSKDKKVKDFIIDSFTATYTYESDYVYKSKYANVLKIDESDKHEYKEWPSDRIRRYLLNKEIIDFEELPDDLGVLAYFTGNYGAFEDSRSDFWGCLSDPSDFWTAMYEIKPYQRVFDLCAKSIELEGLTVYEDEGSTPAFFIYKTTDGKLDEKIVG